eukprot:5677605-Ditylum_brightwellii.AAC.1
MVSGLARIPEQLEQKRQHKLHFPNQDNIKQSTKCIVFPFEYELAVLDQIPDEDERHIVVGLALKDAAKEIWRKYIDFKKRHNIIQKTANSCQKA